MVYPRPKNVSHEAMRVAARSGNMLIWKCKPHKDMNSFFFLPHFFAFLLLTRIPNTAEKEAASLTP